MQAAVPPAGFRQRPNGDKTGGSSGSGASLHSLKSTLHSINDHREYRKAQTEAKRQAKKQAPVKEAVVADSSPILDDSQADRNFTSPRREYDSDDSRRAEKITKTKANPVSA